MNRQSLSISMLVFGFALIVMHARAVTYTATLVDLMAAAAAGKAPFGYCWPHCCSD